MAGVSNQLLFDHPACVMTHLSAYVQEQLVEVLAPLGIHPRQFGLLNLLIEEDGLSQHQLAGPLNVHRNVMVGLVDEMEQRGLVERRRHPTDRRAHAVHVLPAGRSLHAEAEALVNDFEARLLGGLEPDEAHTFVTLLKRVFVHAGLDHDLHPGLLASGAAPAERR
ncbi:MarR family transcriptional regulator [Streptomyces avermitilis]|uniref:MarR family transcriptional regulator n=1 Tax=Streptomyces avermitilis TaxID=33903 RepID=A0A4D4MAR0_STRAX|nr:MarR family transcriptional regulator [Streptomyces avermitilis]GDY68955.1 MarR family transcriptional regulator [Streptomyces avermitilis]